MSNLIMNFNEIISKAQVFFFVKATVSIVNCQLVSVALSGQQTLVESHASRM